MPKVTFSKSDTLDKQLSVQLETVRAVSAGAIADNELDLSGNPLGRRTQDELLSMIDVIKGSPFNHVSLAKTGLQLKTGKDIAEIIGRFKGSLITSINLAGNWLGLVKSESEFKEIVTALQQSSFKKVDLSDNKLGRMKPEEFVQCLKMLGNSALEEVKLDKNELDVQGGPFLIGELLAKYLGKRATLEDSDTFTNLIVQRMQDVFVSATADTVQITKGP